MLKPPFTTVLLFNPLIRKQDTTLWLLFTTPSFEVSDKCSTNVRKLRNSLSSYHRITSLAIYSNSIWQAIL